MRTLILVPDPDFDHDPDIAIDVNQRMLKKNADRNNHR